MTINAPSTLSSLARSITIRQAIWWSSHLPICRLREQHAVEEFEHCWIDTKSRLNTNGIPLDAWFWIASVCVCVLCLLGFIAGQMAVDRLLWTIWQRNYKCIHCTHENVRQSWLSFSLIRLTDDAVDLIWLESACYSMYYYNVIAYLYAWMRRDSRIVLCWWWWWWWYGVYVRDQCPFVAVDSRGLCEGEREKQGGGVRIGMRNVQFSVRWLIVTWCWWSACNGRNSSTKTSIHFWLLQGNKHQNWLPVAEGDKTEKKMLSICMIITGTVIHEYLKWYVNGWHFLRVFIDECKSTARREMKRMGQNWNVLF